MKISLNTHKYSLIVIATFACFVSEGSASASGGLPDPVIEAPEQTPLISSGTPAHNCQWPTTVMLLADGALCSGTLVHPQIVTTAGHCPHPEEIVFGESAFSPKRTVPVDHCKRNPDYREDDNYGVNGNDFAYCKLAYPVYDIPFTPPVYGCELEILTPDRPAVIVGFGNNHGENGAGTKRWTETKIRSLVDDASTTVLVGEAGHAACSGDSGGPAFVQYPDGSWHAFGITSGGPPCGVGADVYSLIHRAVPWIEENSGVDITPCHDVDGTWNPTPECQGFATDTLDVSVAWTNWCATPRLGPAATCGEAFEHESPAAPIRRAQSELISHDDQDRQDVGVEWDTDDVEWGTDEELGCAVADRRGAPLGLLLGLLGVAVLRRRSRSRDGAPDSRMPAHGKIGPKTRP